jgi:hypothetical protein
VPAEAAPDFSLVTDPEEMCRVLAETRDRQGREALRALKVLSEALHLYPAEEREEVTT